MPDLPDISAFAPMFESSGKTFNIDPMLLKALALQESGGDPRAYNQTSGAAGLMQIIKPTGDALGLKDPYDPGQSIAAGAKYMDEALTAEQGNLDNALLYYHGGPGWRQRYGKESQGFVPGVANYYKQLQAAQQKAQEAATNGR